VSIEPGQAQSKSADAEEIRELLERISRFRFDGSNMAYEISVTAEAQRSIESAIEAVIESGDVDKLSRLEDMLSTLDLLRGDILRFEYGVEGERRRTPTEIQTITGLGEAEYARERAAALTQLSGLEDYLLASAV
jgi:hypothetical protein